jgi:hypothetical protein
VSLASVTRWKIFNKHMIYDIAEDPVLLSGTLRSTLDIFGDYDDAEIVRIFLHFTGFSAPFSHYAKV